MPDSFSKTSILKTPWFDFVAKDYQNGEAPHYVIEAPDYASIIARTEEKKIVLVRQYRQTIDEYTLEFPSGHVDEGESPLESAKRELHEETTYREGNWQELTPLRSDLGRINNHARTFFADQVKRDPNAIVEQGIETLEVTLDDVIKQIIQGNFIHSIHVSALFLAIQKKLF